LCYFTPSTSTVPVPVLVLGAALCALYVEVLMKHMHRKTETRSFFEYKNQKEKNDNMEGTLLIGGLNFGIIGWTKYSEYNRKEDKAMIQAKEYHEEENLEECYEDMTL